MSTARRGAGTSSHAWRRARFARPGPSPALLVVPLALLAWPVAAQQAAAPAPAAPAASAALPPIRVTAPADPSGASEGTGSYTVGTTSTATGLSLSIRETPQSVTVITRQRMDDEGATSIADVLGQSTGITIKAIDRGRNGVAARGFAITTYQFDGIPIETGNVGLETSDSDVYDRVEIVRGANGLLVGSGDPSAVVNLVRKRADSRTPAGQVRLRIGSWNERSGMVDLSSPLTADGRIRARIVAGLGRQDAFVDLERTDRRQLYGVIDADLGPGTRLGLGAHYERVERNGVLWVGLPYWFADGSRTDWDRSKTSATHWNQWDTANKTLFATLEQRLAGDWQLRGLLQRHQQVENSKLQWMWGNVDPATGLGLEGQPYHYLSEPRQVNAGLVATGPFSAWGRRHEVSAGLSYRRSAGGWSNRDGAVAAMPDFIRWDGSLPEPAMGPRYQGSYTTVTQSGVYAATRLALSDRWKAIVGARLSNWKNEDEAGAWTPVANTYRVRDEITPYLALTADLARTVTAYASYTGIFKPQDLRDFDGSLLDPVEGRSYELGLKGELFDGGVVASAAVFRTEQDNVGVQAPQPNPLTGQPYFVPRNGIRVQGYELELAGEPVPQLSLSMGWSHFTAQDADGADVLTEHPRRTLKLGGTYRFAGTLPGLVAGAELNWQSRQPYWDTNPGTGRLERAGQPAYGLVDLMAAYEFSRRLRLQLNLDNAFDETYREASFWGNAFTYGEPRRWRLTLEARY